MMVVGRFGGPRLAIDLGTGRTRVASLDEPILAEIPSTVHDTAVTVGSLALAHSVHRPIDHGVVVDVDATARMLAPQIRAGRRNSPWKPGVLVCHPSDASAEERERLIAAVLWAGAGPVRLAPEPVAALFGSTEGASSMTGPRLIIDLGEGITDVAVVRDGQVLANAAVRSGLGDLRSSLRERIQDAHGVDLLPAEISSLLTSETKFGGWVSVPRALRRRRRTRPDGRRMLSESVLVSGSVVASVVGTAVEAIAQRVSAVLRSLDSRDSKALASEPPLLTGGGALIPGLRHGISVELGGNVDVAPDPMHAVIRGARRILQAGPPDGWRTDFDAALICPA